MRLSRSPLADPPFAACAFLALLFSACTCARDHAGMKMGDRIPGASSEPTPPASFSVSTVSAPAPICPDNAAQWVRVIDPENCEAPRELLLGGAPGCLIREPTLR